jgi:hypothetical protein
MRKRALIGGLLAVALAAFITMRWLAPAPATSAAPTQTLSKAAAEARPPAGSIDTGLEGQARVASPAQSEGVSSALARANRPSTPEVTFQVPSNAQVGDVFKIAVDIDTRELIGRVAILVEYDFKRIELRSATAGDFVKRSGIPQRFSAEEPSDGRMVINLQVEDGMAPLAGRGSIAVLEFEAKAPGSALVNVTSVTLYRTPDDAVPITLPGRQSSIVVN